MIQSYQNLIHTHIKNNKDQIFGFIIGLLVLLTIFKQSIGLPLLFIFIIAIGGLIKPSKEYLIIASLLVFKIIIIAIITKNNLHDINLENIKFFIRRIIVDVVILFMLFVALKNGEKIGFYYFCIILFIIDLIFNAYAQLSGFSIYGFPIEMRIGDLMGRSGGIFNHPFYSIDISLIALFCALFLKRRLLLVFVVVNLVLAGSQRGLVSLLLIVILYFLTYFHVKINIINVISTIFILTIFMGVNYLASSHPGLVAHNERIFRWEYGLDVITSNLDNLNSYIRFQPEVFYPHLARLIDSKYNIGEALYKFNAESYYLSEMVNYGIIIGFISIIALYLICKFNLNSVESKLDNESMLPIIFSYFIFLESFYSYSIGAILTTFFYSVFVLKSRLNNILN